MSFGDDAYLGESLRGPQDGYDSHMGGNVEIGAAQRQLQGAMRTLAGQRFNRNAPLQKEIRSPYRDSTQLGILITGTVTPSQYATETNPLPIISGKSRAYQSFKPEKIIMTEVLIATFTNASGVSVKVAASVSDASDLVLVQAYSGNYNCFPNAPDDSNGISGAAFAFNALGNGISWPTINPGIDVSAGIAIEETVLYRVVPPDGYTTDDLETVKVKVRVNIFGPQLR